MVEVTLKVLKGSLNVDNNFLNTYGSTSGVYTLEVEERLLGILRALEETSIIDILNINQMEVLDADTSPDKNKITPDPLIRDGEAAPPPQILEEAKVGDGGNTVLVDGIAPVLEDLQVNTTAAVVESPMDNVHKEKPSKPRRTKATKKED